MVREKLSIEKLLENGESLPTLPEIYTRVSDMLEDDNSSVNEIGNIIATDPAISYKILTMVNSAYYGLPNEISSITQAISLLGRFRLKQILIGALLSEIFQGLDSEYFSLHDFWKHSIRTAIIANQLARYSEYSKEPETLFTAGLLHDVGRLILASQMPEVLVEIEARAEKTRWSIEDAELDVIGITHSEIGGALMLKWGFPDLIWVCVKHHHDIGYSGPFFQAAQMVSLSNQLAAWEAPEDDLETLEMLRNIPNWQDAGATLETIQFACLTAEEMVYDVMQSLGMVNLEIAI